MGRYPGRFSAPNPKEPKGLPFVLVFLSFLAIEAFGLVFLMPEGERLLYPVMFGLFWSGLLSGVIFLLPGIAAGNVLLHEGSVPVAA
jgi:hypothetical protein